MAGIFKAYDVRGTYPDQIDETIAVAIGRAFKSVLDPEAVAAHPQVVVSRDMRSHGQPLAAALIEGIRDSGLDVLDIGLATTPMNYFAVGSLGTAGGVQVTASHNPARYNGFKFSRHGARPVSGDEGIPAIERRVKEGDFEPGSRRGEVSTGSVTEAYHRHVLSFLEKPPAGRRLKVAVDAGNGMGTIYRPLLEAAGIELIPLYFELDGSFPNHEANPLKLENLRDLCRAVREHGADLGVAFDGDADRAAFVDERGEPVGSDLATALIGGELLAHHPGRHVVYDLRSSRAVAEYIREKGGIPVRERVGHSFIKATLRRDDGIFGGELAGHYYFRDNYFADCAVLAVFEILNLIGREGKPFSQIVAPLKRYAKSEEINFEVEDKAGLMRAFEQRYAGGEVDYLDGVTVQFESWWANVRPSNTEPYLRLVLEASTPEELEARKHELIELLGEPAE
ncbi:MAG TPA: phosphomannomutase/phosphoglucomutase [Thermoanaerobaculia bacterium]|nr:phosphomannomutase/phosphoglucomutase [Thermoanaerobaculia bacterium]